jgi:hypothetical protein
MSMTQCIVERATFQAIASLALPAIVIHQSVHVSKKLFTKWGRFVKWGPSVVGLSLIPFFPICLDEPVEHAVEWAFHHYGPWTKKEHVMLDRPTTTNTTATASTTTITGENEMVTPASPVIDDDKKNN